MSGSTDGADQRKGATVHDLPVEVLLQVFPHLCFMDRIRHLPFVCKRWNEALQFPSDVWTQVTIGHCCVPESVGQLKRQELDTWFRKRGSCVRHLRLESIMDDDASAAWLSIVLPYVAPTLLSLSTELSPPPSNFFPLLSRCHRVEKLSVPTSRDLSEDNLKVLSGFARLLSLTLDIQHLPENSMSLVHTLGTMTTLQELVLYVCSDIPGLERTVGTLPSLRELTICYEHEKRRFPGDILRLTTLHHLSLRRPSWPWVPAWQLPPAFNQLKALASLSIGGSFVDPSTFTILSTLTALHHLELSDVGLKAIPDSCSTLSNLETLALQYNRVSALPSWLTSLKQLHAIDLSFQSTGSSEFELPLHLSALQALKRLHLHGVHFLPESADSLPWTRLHCTAGEVDFRVTVHWRDFAGRYVVGGVEWDCDQAVAGVSTCGQENCAVLAACLVDAGDVYLYKGGQHMFDS